MQIDILAIWSECKQIIKDTIELKNKYDQSKDSSLVAQAKENEVLLKEKFYYIIDFIRQHLVIAQDKFYGIMLLNIITEIDFKINGSIDIDLNGRQFKMKFNPFFLNTVESIQELEALVISELLLIALDIPTKYSDYNVGSDPYKHEMLLRASSALSMDLTLTDISVIKERSGMTKKGLNIPKDSYTVPDIRLDTKLNAKNKESFDYYYKLLLNNYEGKSNNGLTQGMSIPNQGQNTNQEYSNEFSNMPNNKNNDTVHNWENPDRKEDNQNKIKRLVKSAYDTAKQSSRGLMPSYLVEQIELLLKPPLVPWQKELKNILGTIRYGYRTTFKKPNRRQPDRLDLPGKTADKIIKIVIGVDTSGSMSKNDIEMVFAEIFNIVKTCPTEITVIECDSKIAKEPYKVKSVKDIQTDIKGRGGTEFTPVVNWINEHNYKDALFIYFTDGCGEYSIPKPKVYKTIWILTNKNEKLSVREPYGKILYLDSDPKFKKGSNN